MYRSAIGSGRMFFAMGPYAAIGISGESTSEGNGLAETRKVKFTATVKTADPVNQEYYKRMDAGLDVFVGYEFNNSVLVKLNFQKGLTNINPVYEGYVNDKSTAKHTGIGVSLGYVL
jgi:hypothetical protein